MDTPQPTGLPTGLPVDPSRLRPVKLRTSVLDDLRCLPDYTAKDTYKHLSAHDTRLFLRREWALANMPESHRRKYRLAIAYRITVEIACKQGLLSYGEKLTDVSLRDRQHCPYDHIPPEHVAAVKDIEPRWERWPMDKLLCDFGGLPLRPHPETAQRFAAAVARLGNDLRLVNGTADLPDLWELALGDIATAGDLVDVWPDRFELEVFEGGVMRHAHDTLIERGRQDAIDDLQGALGLSFGHATNLLRTSLNEHARFSHDDIEDKRYLMECRIEAYLKRCREAMDLDAESRGLKMLAAVQGLTRTDPTTQLDEIVRVIEAIGNGDEPPRPDPRMLVDETKAPPDPFQRETVHAPPKPRPVPHIRIIEP